MNLSFIIRWFPLFFSLAKRALAELSSGNQNALKKAVSIVQDFKLYISQPAADIQSFLIKQYGFSPTVEQIQAVQDKLNVAGLSDFDYGKTLNQFAEDIAKQLDDFDWKAFALGAIQAAFEVWIKKKS